jgi:hypothetical protein
MLHFGPPVAQKMTAFVAAALPRGEHSLAGTATDGAALTLLHPGQNRQHIFRLAPRQEFSAKNKTTNPFPPGIWARLAAEFRSDPLSRQKKRQIRLVGEARLRPLCGVPWESGVPFSRPSQPFPSQPFMVRVKKV